MQSVESPVGCLIHAVHGLYHSILITDIDEVVGLVQVGLQVEEGDRR